MAPGANGVAVLNGLQIISRGTSPPELLAHTVPQGAPANTNLLFREIHYTGKVTDTEARFAAVFEVESMATNEISATLFEGDVAVLAPQLPRGLRIVGSGNEFRLFAVRPGNYQVRLELVAKIARHEPWNQISFAGPAAAIASVDAQVMTAWNFNWSAVTGGNRLSRRSHFRLYLTCKAFSGPIACSRCAGKARPPKSRANHSSPWTPLGDRRVTPPSSNSTPMLHYEILQAGAPQLTIALPTGHALTKLQGEQIRDWQIKPDGDRQVLTVEFIKPVEKSYALTLFSEQPVENSAQAVRLTPPQPLDVERESGSFAISADEMAVDIDSVSGLRQVSAPKDMLAAYRFYGRPFALMAKLKRIEPC